MPWKAADLTVAEWGYIAGILDGEGCMGIYLRGSRHLGSRQKTPSANYRPHISVHNTNLDLLRWLQERIGGNISTKTKIPGQKQTWTLGLGGGRAREVAWGAMPYLVIKREQALLILRFPFGAKCNQWTPEKTGAVRLLKEELHQATLILNRRGDSDSLAS